MFPMAAVGCEERQDPLKEVLMIQAELATSWQHPDPTQYAAMSFLARYRGATLRA